MKNIFIFTKLCFNNNKMINICLKYGLTYLQNKLHITATTNILKTELPQDTKNSSRPHVEVSALPKWQILQNGVAYNTHKWHIF